MLTIRYDWPTATRETEGKDEAEDNDEAEGKDEADFKDKAEGTDEAEDKDEAEGTDEAECVQEADEAEAWQSVYLGTVACLSRHGSRTGPPSRRRRRARMRRRSISAVAVIHATYLHPAPRPHYIKFGEGIGFRLFI